MFLKADKELSHLYGCVNWNILLCLPFISKPVAPLRVRELKHDANGKGLPKETVAPLRVRELKLLIFEKRASRYKSHLYGCVNWNPLPSSPGKRASSRTFTGAWIETKSSLNGSLFFTVAPLRVRELKLRNRKEKKQKKSRTFTGAWIETYVLFQCLHPTQSRTFTGAWIETLIQSSNDTFL